MVAATNRSIIMAKKLRTLKLTAVLTLFVAVTLLGFTGCGNGEEEKKPHNPFECDDDGLVYTTLPGDPVHDNLTRTRGVNGVFCDNFSCIIQGDFEPYSIEPYVNCLAHGAKSETELINEYKKLAKAGIDYTTPAVSDALHAANIQFHKDLPEHQR